MIGWKRTGALVVMAGAAVAVGSAAACTAGGTKLNNGQGGDGTGNNGQGGIIFTGTGGGSTTVVWPPCDQATPDGDIDGDGFSPNQGDCNDCTELVNPAAMDYPGNTFDEDCNGTPDDTPTACDGQLPLTGSNPLDAAGAIGLCKMQQGASWGLISAAYSKANGSPGDDPLGHGILNAFGPNVHPQEGSKMLALSSGTARQPTDSGYEDPAGHDKGYGDFGDDGAPPGYPKESPSCPGVSTGTPHDSEQLLLRVKTPSNAKSFSFNLDFYTWEFPDYICSTYNDFFVAYLTPKLASLPDGNISFDSQGNTISVNAGFLQVCEAQSAGGKSFPCPLGTSELQGTGFDAWDPLWAPVNHAATGWLVTNAPLEVPPGGEIELRFAIWDSGDGVLDSTILIDNFQWGLEETPTGTTPVDIPK